MRSTNNYPKFQAIRDEMDTRPFRYLQKRGLAIFLLEEWRDRGYDIKYRVMREQKREPHIYCGKWYGDW